jgi:hypothetical protein
MRVWKPQSLKVYAFRVNSKRISFDRVDLDRFAFLGISSMAILSGELLDVRRCHSASQNPRSDRENLV